jgi:hypothetical protein
MLIPLFYYIYDFLNRLLDTYQAEYKDASILKAGKIFFLDKVEARTFYEFDEAKVGPTTLLYLILKDDQGKLYQLFYLNLGGNKGLAIAAATFNYYINGKLSGTLNGDMFGNYYSQYLNSN